LGTYQLFNLFFQQLFNFYWQVQISTL